jgi:putative tricarboxylic transport membrane protein
MTKGLIMASLGMLLASVGLDPMLGTPRFDFGSVYLTGGIDVVILAIGMFGLNEVFNSISDPPGPGEIIKPPKRFLELLPNRQEWKDSAAPISRGSILGFLVGILPGGGGILASISSYVVEKKLSKHPKRFGTGEIAGVAGPESANNGSSAGAFIPLLTLGIPSNTQVAILLGALMIQGITPGPMFMQTRPDVFWGVIASMYIGNVILLILNLPMIGLFTKIAFVPSAVVTPIIASICIISVFLLNFSPYDVLVLAAIGIFSFITRAHGFDAAPFIFGFILGPLLEFNLRQSLVISQGDLSFFIAKPLPAILIGIAFLLLFSPFFKKLFKRIMNNLT